MTAADYALISVAGVQAFATVVLVVITGIYAWRTFAISKATDRQADASMKMAKEAEEQRLIASRPTIIQKAVRGKTVPPTRYFSHFEIYNAGNGPAIELETTTMNKEKEWVGRATRETFLRADDTSEFHPDFATLGENVPYHLVCQYQGIFSRTGEQQTWYQTRLPFKFAKASEEGKFYVTSGELEFKEVTEKERINPFGGGKPQ